MKGWENSLTLPNLVSDTVLISCTIHRSCGMLFFNRAPRVLIWFDLLRVTSNPRSAVSEESYGQTESLINNGTSEVFVSPCCLLDSLGLLGSESSKVMEFIFIFKGARQYVLDYWCNTLFFQQHGGVSTQSFGFTDFHLLYPEGTGHRTTLGFHAQWSEDQHDWVNTF